MKKETKAKIVKTFHKAAAATGKVARKTLPFVAIAAAVILGKDQLDRKNGSKES